MEVTVKTRLTGIQTPEARETRAPGTDTSVNDRWNLLLRLEKLGFKPRNQGRQEVAGLILPLMMDGS